MDSDTESEPGVEHTEHSPLLRRDSDTSSRNTTDPTPQPKLLTKNLIIIVGAFSCKFLFSLGSAFVELPLLQLQEDILCRHSSSAGPPDWPCKQDDVQKELSVLRQWLIMADLLPTLLVGVPMGIVADRYGRTIVLGLALFGATLATGAAVLICAFPEVVPLRLIWLTPVLTLIGGGEVTVLTMVYAMVADVTDEAQRWVLLILITAITWMIVANLRVTLRSVTFSLFTAGMAIGGMLESPLTYLLMKRSPWLSIYVGLALSVFSTLLGFSLPESLKKGSLPEDISDPQYNEDDTANGHNHSSFARAAAQAKAGAARFLTFLHLLFTKERQVGLLLLSLLFTTFGRDAALMLIQYVHIRFGWEWSEVISLLFLYTNSCTDPPPGSAPPLPQTNRLFRSLHPHHPPADNPPLLSIPFFPYFFHIPLSAPHPSPPRPLPPLDRPPPPPHLRDPPNPRRPHHLPLSHFPAPNPQHRHLRPLERLQHLRPLTNDLADGRAGDRDAVHGGEHPGEPGDFHCESDSRGDAEVGD